MCVMLRHMFCCHTIAAALVGAVFVTIPFESAIADDQPGGDIPVQFHCCDSKNLENVLESYLHIYQALADETTAANRNCYAMETKLKRAKSDTALTADDRQVLSDMLGLVDQIKDRKLSGIGQRFGELSQKMTFLVLNHQNSDGKHLVAEAFCEGKGPWVQAGEELKSPFGSNEKCSWR
ncbi:MAG: hypothetical protein HN348_23950 [Proteobacteria bacterium]|jgi:hypothetical protein|nr:hypothetical protein [Pseudomonadota bacterium]